MAGGEEEAMAGGRNDLTSALARVCVCIQVYRARTQVYIFMYVCIYIRM